MTELIRADARHIPLADESVQCCVTSPPYWGLRSYHGGENMIGLEPTFEQHIENLVAVFREVRRVLRQDGTCWINYGDAYTSGGRSTYRSGVSDNKGHQVQDDMPRPATPADLKPKDLMLMPARVALALQADGWWVRSEVVWHKPNPMPESVTDRPTNAHEKVYLLTKSPRYFYDSEAVRTPQSPTAHGGSINPKKPPRDGHEGSPGYADALTGGANLRNVWTISTQGVSAAHFATFPEALVEPCILAGTSAEGACAQCGALWERMVDKERIPVQRDGRTTRIYKRSTDRNSDDARNIKSDGLEFSYRVSTTGWKPTCDCEAPTVPCTVLDPFVGSGTVCRVATRLNRRGIGCDLTYQDIAKKRTSKVQRVLHLG